MVYRKTEEGRQGELIAQVCDRRSRKGRGFYGLYEAADSKGNSSMVRLLERVALDFKALGITVNDRTGIYIDVDPERGKRNEKIGRCSYCSQPLREVNKLRFSYDTSAGRVKAGKVAGTAAHAGYIGTTQVGNDCMDHLKYIARKLGDSDFLGRFTKKGQEMIAAGNETALQKALEIPPEITERLKAAGIDPEAVKRFPDLLAVGSDLLAGNVEMAGFRLDRANRRNWYNWLKERYEADEISDTDVNSVVMKLESNIHRLTDDEARLAVNYIYQLRLEPAEGRIGSLRRDLLFLAQTEGLDLDMPFLPILLYSGPDYKPEKQKKVKRALEGDLITYAEAVGLKMKFPGMDERRRKRNREFIERYFGDGANFDIAVEEVEKLFGENVGRFAESGKEAEQLMPLENHRTLAYFFRIARKGMGTLRENSIQVVPMADSQKVYRTIFVEVRKLALVEKEKEPLAQMGIRHTSYIPDVDLPHEFVAVLYKMQKTYVPEKFDEDEIPGVGGATLKRFHEFRKRSLEAVEEAIKIGLVPESFVVGKKAMTDFARVVDGYTKKSAEEIEETESLAQAAKLFDLKFFRVKRGRILYSETVQDFDAVKIGEAQYMSLWQRKITGHILGVIKSDEELCESLCAEESLKKDIEKVRAAEGKILYSRGNAGFYRDHGPLLSRKTIGRVSMINPFRAQQMARVLEVAKPAADIDFFMDLARKASSGWQRRFADSEAPGLLTQGEYETLKDRLLVKKETVECLKTLYDEIRYMEMA